MKFIKEQKWIILLIILNLIALYGVKTIYNLSNSTKESYEEIKSVNTIQSISKKGLDKNLSVLLLGLDRKVENSQRADAIIVATYNVKDNSIKMTRIPRDVYIKTINYEGKINSIYDEQSRDHLIHVVENYLNIPIKYYVETNFDGLISIVDDIGGIDINSKIIIDKTNNQQVGKNINIKKGFNHLNGKEALAYSRIRYIDNDIERGNRQEQVLKAIVKKLMEPSQIINIDKNAQLISKHIKTNLKPIDVIQHASSLTQTPDIQTIKFNWVGFEWNGISYVKLESNERSKLSRQLRQHLRLDLSEQLPKMIIDPQ